MTENESGNPLDSSNSANEVRRLIENGADVNARDFRGSTPLYWNRNVAAILAMISVGADARVKDRLGATPLHTQKKVRIVRALIEAGADVNAADKDNYVALHLAWHPAAVFELLRAGADPNLRNHKGESVETNYGGGSLAKAMTQMVQEVRVKGHLLQSCWQDYMPRRGKELKNKRSGKTDQAL